MKAGSLARLSLGIAGLAFGGFGLALLVRPRILSRVGVEIARPAAAAELRGFYGGLELGVGAFFAVAAGRPSWHRPALFLQAATLGGAAAARALSVAVEGGAEPLIRALAAAEATAAGVALLALRSLPERAEAGERSEPSDRV